MERCRLEVCGAEVSTDAPCPDDGLDTEPEGGAFDSSEGVFPRRCVFPEVGPC